MKHFFAISLSSTAPHPSQKPYASKNRHFEQPQAVRNLLFLIQNTQE